MCNNQFFIKSLFSRLTAAILFVFSPAAIVIAIAEETFPDTLPIETPKVIQGART